MGRKIWYGKWLEERCWAGAKRRGKQRIGGEEGTKKKEKKKRNKNFSILFFDFHPP